MLGDNTFDPAEIIDRVAGCVSSAGGPVALTESRLGPHDIETVTDCVKSGQVSSAGPWTDRFEAQLAAITGAGVVLATVTGTAALELALEMVGVGPGDEVLLPAFTYVSTANAVGRRGATPHFLDSEPVTGGVDARRLADYLTGIADVEAGRARNRQTGRTLAALVLVHILGSPADSDAVGEVCETLGIPLVEDAAQALGSLRGNQHVGRRGKCAVLSFNGNKIVTTGGGGALFTDDEELGHRARHLATNAKVADGHDQPGLNLRMPSLNAALGQSQLDQLASFVGARRELARRYITAFEGCDAATAVVEPPGCRSNYWLSAIDLAPSIAPHRDSLVEAAAVRGIEVRPPWRILSELPMYDRCPAMSLTGSRDIIGRRVLLPSSQSLLLDAS